MCDLPALTCLKEAIYRIEPHADRGQKNRALKSLSMGSYTNRERKKKEGKGKEIGVQGGPTNPAKYLH